MLWENNTSYIWLFMVRFGDFSYYYYSLSLVLLLLGILLYIYIGFEKEDGKGEEMYSVHLIKASFHET